MPDPKGPVLTELVKEMLAASFPEREVREATERLLCALAEVLSERVMLAVVKLSDGEFSKLMAAIAAALEDERDVLGWAEYPEQMALPPGAAADVVAEARTRDRAQYQRWLRRTS